LEAAKFEAVETLRDGRRFKIRSLRPDDRSGLLAAVDRSSPLSLYRRFFSPKRHFAENEIARFVNVDFVNHVALVAELEEGGRDITIGGCRYIVVDPGRAEVAFVVVDHYQGQGVGVALMRHLVAISRNAGLKELMAEVLIAMLKIFEKSGLQLRTSCEAGIAHVRLQLS
jgi:GNAT superfamily N-acetyltransferase